MAITNVQRITLPIDRLNYPVMECVEVKQWDTSSRRVEITLTQDDVLYTIPSGTTARFRFLKPNGAKVLIDGSISNNKVIVDYTAAMLTVAGLGKGEVVLFNGNSQIASARFDTKIAVSVFDDSVNPSEEIKGDYQTLGNIITAADKATASANSAATTANNAAKSATDTANKAASSAQSTANSAAKTATDAATTANNAAKSATTAANDCKTATANIRIFTDTVTNKKYTMSIENGLLTFTEL